MPIPLANGQWATAFAERGPAALAFEQSGGSPALNEEQQAELKWAVPGSPSQGGIDLSNWNWQVVRRFVEERFGLSLSRSSCLNYLHRLGFVLTRSLDQSSKKRLVKADPVRRKAFVAEYAALRAAARRTGVKIFFADEAHFRADADLRGKWVLKGEPALVGSTSPRRGEKASYYSAVCLETGEVEVMELEDNSNSATSAAFLRQLRVRHYDPLTVIWDNSPAHRGAALWAYLATPDLNLCLVNLPSTAQTSTPTRLSGGGCARRRPQISVWALVPQCGRKWATSSPVCPPVARKSNGAAEPRCKHKWKNYRIPGKDRHVLGPLCRQTRRRQAGQGAHGAAGLHGTRG